MSVIKIEAFTFEYNQLQDRICVSCNLYNAYPEISFWLTRRLALRLLAATVDLVKKTSPKVSGAPQEHKQAMALFEHQSAQINGSDNVKQTAPLDAAESELLEPKILHRLDISYRKKRYHMSFFEVGQEEAVAVSVVDYAQFHQVLSLIHSGALELDWGVDKTLFAAPANEQVKYTLQ